MSIPKTIRVLALGDLVGRPGRRVVREKLAQVRAEHKIDFVICNVENATNGAGTRIKEAQDIIASGVDCCTNGDHIVDYPEIFPMLNSNPRLLRPINYKMAGHGAWVYPLDNGVKIGVINACGQVFMKPHMEATNPFPLVDEAVAKMREQTPVVFLDMHGEATSEKVAMGWMLDGKVSGVFGSHTHVQTADVQVLPQGTGYITDLGMTGPYHSVIGRDKDLVVQRFLTEKHIYMKVARRWARMSGAIFTVESATGHCVDAQLFTHKLEADEAANDPQYIEADGA
ncbi:MAG: YmdB family metallophosphoesterase [Planctomycetes bacterium]|nr:YmdB family metallophosphoesterase [Planctomycetota bacterium]